MHLLVQQRETEKDDEIENKKEAIYLSTTERVKPNVVIVTILMYHVSQTKP